MSVTLTAEQVGFYRRHGYLRLDSIATADEIAWVREIYDRLFATSAGRDVGDSFDLAGSDDDASRSRLPQLMNPAKYAPELSQAAFHQAALAVARQLLGPDAEAGDEHAICKPGDDGAETPWHQDEAYWDPAFHYDAISVWVPLQPATVENGCLQFVPGSHEGDILAHDSIGGDPRVHGLQAVGVKPKEAVACPLPTGGCTIHHCRTLHYAGPNRSGEPRRAYILTFQRPPEVRTDGRRFPWIERRKTARLHRAAIADKGPRRNRD